jgi:hypothetical protein
MENALFAYYKERKRKMSKTKVKASGEARYQRMLEEAIKERKKELLAEFAISLNEIREEVDPWIEIIDNKEFIFKQVQNVSQFGTLILLFEEKYNSDNQIRLPLQLKL